MGAVGRPGTAPDYWTASKTSLEQANAHRRVNETQAACAALAKSLDYYRIALDKELLGKMARPAGRDEGDAMHEIRSRFGCTGPSSADPPLSRARPGIKALHARTSSVRHFPL